MEKKMLAMVTFPPHKAYLLIPLANDPECKVEYDGAGLPNITIEGGLPDLPAAYHPGLLKGRKIPPKYRDPVTGKTWAGRGMRPKWIEAELASGKNMLDFLIVKPVTHRPRRPPPGNHHEYYTNILEALRKEPMTYGDLHKVLGVSFGALTQFIAHLKEENKIKKNLLGVWSLT